MTIIPLPTLKAGTFIMDTVNGRDLTKCLLFQLGSVQFAVHVKFDKKWHTSECSTGKGINQGVGKTSNEAVRALMDFFISNPEKWNEMLRIIKEHHDIGK